MPSVKVGANVSKNEEKSEDTSSEVTVVGRNVPTFKIKTIPGVFQVEEPAKPTDADVQKQSLNKDFRHFIDRDIRLRYLYRRLRLLAVALFTCALAATVLAVVDIELARRRKIIVAEALHCEDTYVHSYNRYCPALDDPYGLKRDDLINETVYELLSPHTTFFGRWKAANMEFAEDYWVAGTVIKCAMSLITFTAVCLMYFYHSAEISVLKIKRYLPEDSRFMKSPKIKSFIFKTFVTCLHVPPIVDAWIAYEAQLIVTLRLLLSGIKVMKECNELRYHRLGNVLSNLARIKIHGTFLLKTYFLRHPKATLFIVYLMVVVIFPYFVILAEFQVGNVLEFKDAWWLLMVTVTNLGSGEVRPTATPSRIVVGCASLIGIVTTALWVNVFSKYFDLPQEERRILAMVEHQRVRRLERNKAATCVQAAWRLHSYRAIDGTRRKSKLDALEKANKKAMLEWNSIRHNCSQIRRKMESNFSTEDTLIVARNMARRMSTNTKIPSTSIESPRKSIADVVWEQRRSFFYRPSKENVADRRNTLSVEDANSDRRSSSFVSAAKPTKSDFSQRKIEKTETPNRTTNSRGEDGNTLRALEQSLVSVKNQIRDINEHLAKMERGVSIQLSEIEKNIKRLKT